MCIMNKLGTGKRVQIVKALVEGMGVNATCRLTGAAKHTVLKLLRDLGAACAKYHDEHVRELGTKRVQVDEIWSFCYARKQNVPAEKRGQFGFGDVWTWTALDADSKLMVSYLVGDRDTGYATEFMHDVAGRLADRVQLTSDGLRSYFVAVPDAFGDAVDYARLVKVYGKPLGCKSNPNVPDVCIGAVKSAAIGNPDAAHISTSYVERSNLSMRMHMRRFTRLTNAHSKKIENHCHMIALYFMHYNYCKIHSTLRVTPAMEAKLSDHVWEVDELLTLID